MSLGQQNRGSVGIQKDSEFRCEICQARCTRSPVDGETEYGHLIGCPERPDHFEVRASGGNHYYDGGDDQ